MAAPTLFPESGFRRLRLDIAYDGTHFFGWATQPGHRTLQELIEEAISRISQTNIDSIVAGRTDAGVHATGQVIHVDVPDAMFDRELTYLDLRYKLNRILDEDVRIMNVSDAPQGFHARFSALRRYYSYKILDNNDVIAPLSRHDVASWYRPLDADRMNEASALLLGHHDFAAFCKFKVGGTTIRTLEKYEWHRSAEGLLVADVVADAFCYSMVRNLVGAVVCVADGRQSPAWIAQLLANKERVSDSLVFPARGLTLYQVDYPSNDQLLERAKITVAKRG
ncbi:tRNA pseudouridine(38-40) synthase TruA [Candidatus Planktophila versatilis]|uniref:tRNA pseudouridine(38-40) synthase TruA n=1 Tax=Candidatus Planktophila versatilis TaxID=1884905 RepID=UPI000BACAAE0|nr:tRNA pseudouridine(38-40) synthase TruA [Candidatus Planktophila versatilis]ASY26753.1 tRNA pseudouridine38-40 synthase [Candidatus Planktophila versatilis]